MLDLKVRTISKRNMRKWVLLRLTENKVESRGIFFRVIKKNSCFMTKGKKSIYLFIVFYTNFTFFVADFTTKMRSLLPLRSAGVMKKP